MQLEQKDELLLPPPQAPGVGPIVHTLFNREMGQTNHRGRVGPFFGGPTGSGAAHRVSTSGAEQAEEHLVTKADFSVVNCRLSGDGPLARGARDPNDPANNNGGGGINMMPWFQPQIPSTR